MKKLTKILGGGIITIGALFTGYSVLTISNNIQDYNWGIVNAPEELWASYNAEKMFHFTENWERYQELVNKANPGKKFVEGERFILPDIDRDSLVWINGDSTKTEIGF